MLVSLEAVSSGRCGLFGVLKRQRSVETALSISRGCRYRYTRDIQERGRQPWGWRDLNPVCHWRYKIPDGVIDWDYAMQVGLGREESKL